jgi:ribonuclease III
MDRLEDKLGYTFRNKALIQEALTHSSWANENKKSGIKCNERLEFLGDSVLGFTVAEFLYRKEPEMPEGLMTRVRAELVCEKSLEGAASELELGTYLRLGRGEEQSGGGKRPSILADAFEAVLAAVFLDAGIEQAKAMVEKFVLCQYSDGEQTGYDYKTVLQELVQRKSGQTLLYHMTGESGPDHAKQFIVEVRLNGAAKGEGTGKTKKEAEQAAAKAAYEEMIK